MDNSTKVVVDIGATNSAKGVLSSALKDFQGFWKAASGGTDAKGASSAFEDLGNKMGLANPKALLVAGGIGLAVGATVAIGAAAVKAAGDFQEMTTTLVTTAGESQKNLAMIRDGMLDVSKQTGTTVQALNGAMYTIESAQIHGADALKVLTAAAEGAKTENADVGKVADAVTSSLTDYHMKASDAALMTSKLVAAVGSGKSNFQDFTSALHSVLPAASAAHVSLNDILGDLASMTIHGMSADQATQNLTDVIRHMQNPTAVQAKELAMLGLTTTQLAGDLQSKGLSGTLGEISDRIKKLMPPGSDKVVLNLKTALQGLSPAVKELGQHLFDGSMSMAEYNKAASKLEPIAAKQAMSFGTLAGSTHRIGDQQMSGAAVMQNYGQALAKATGDATGLNVALMLTGENADTTKKAIKAVGDAHTEAGNHVAGWSIVQKNFNFVMDQWKATLAAIMIQIGTGLLPAVTAVARYLLEGLGAAVSFVVRLFKSFGSESSGAVRILTMAFNALKPSLTALWNSIVKQLGPAVADLGKQLLELWKAIAPVLIPVLKALAIVVGAALYAAIWMTINALRIFVDALAILGHMNAAVIGWITGIINIFKSLWNLQFDMYKIGVQIIEGLISGLIPGSGKVIAQINKMGSDMIKGLKGILGIHSPSTIFAEIGHNMGAGLIKGLEGVTGKATVAVNGLVTGSNLVNSNGGAASAPSISTTHNSSTNNANSNFSIGQLIVQAPNNSTMKSIIDSINQDSINVGRGGAPVQGAY